MGLIIAYGAALVHAGVEGGAAGARVLVWLTDYAWIAGPALALIVAILRGARAAA